MDTRRLFLRSLARIEREAARPVLRKRSMRFPPFSEAIHSSIETREDYTRLATFGAALSRLHQEGIQGAMAEVGVWRGDTSVLLNRLAPERHLHLFDTFRGFDANDLGADSQGDARFRDTTEDFVRSRLPAQALATLHPGHVPGTLRAVADEQFAFVLLDLDLHAPTAASLDFFYPRLAPGGFLFLHDYNSPESNWACKRAMDAFVSDKPDYLVDIPDKYGSILFRKAAGAAQL